MPKFLEDIVISLPIECNEKINNKISDFVNAMSQKLQSSDYYVNKRNASIDTVLDNISTGKKAEFFVAYCLKYNFKFPAVMPSLEIRSSKQKGWEPDLDFGKELPKVHVKCCTVTTYKYCNDFSWTFQYKENSNQDTDIIFRDGSDDLIALIFLENSTSQYATIKAMLSWSQIKSLLKDPRKSSLKGFKKCLYYKDLLSNSVNLIKE